MLLRGTSVPRASRRLVGSTVGGLSVALLLAACSNGSSTGAASNPGPSGSTGGGKTGEKVTVNWFVGLGTGADQGQPEKEKKVVDAFNASHPNINLKMNVVANKVAADTLATQVAGGNGPDLVGPVGIKGANQFDGQWLDLAPLVDKFKFDTSKYDPQTLKAQKDRTGAQTALPFGVYPSMIWYNKDLFDEAGLPYPPHKFGEKYKDGRPWDQNTMRAIAKKLTVDAAGNDATSPKFDPKKVVQWGYDPQYAEAGPNYNGSLFGAGSFAGGADGKTAQIPANWLAEWKWYYDMIWKDHSAPNATQLASDQLSKGNAFESGKVAMAFTHTWYMCCMSDSKGKAQTFWDIAATPSYNGKQTAKLHSDSFRIFAKSKHPDEAFQVLSYFLTDGAPELLKIYNAMPADQKLQDDYFASLDKTYTQGVDWQVAKDALGYPDIPNHEGYIPNFNKSGDLVSKMGTKLLATPNLNIDTEAAKLKTGLQALFNASS